MRLHYTEAALSEIQGIFDYIAEKNLAAARSVVSRIDQTASLIAQFPNIGRLKYRGIVRMLPVRRYPQYLIFYLVGAEDTVILSVRHAARRPLWDDAS